MKTRYKIFEDCDYYFVTSTILDWMPVFRDEKYCRIIIDSLEYCRKFKGLKLYYYVIMPDHIHAIISSEKNRIVDIMRDFKRFTSKSISSLAEDEETQFVLRKFRKYADKDKNCKYRVWQSGFHPQAITSDDMLNQKMEYIHQNPVVAGYVKEDIDWKYSSARNIYLEDNSVIELDDMGM
jgi:putative transposase